MTPLRAIAPTLPGVTPGPQLLMADGPALPVLAPRAELITIEAIARGLSRICRWGGHTREWFSVAQHSVLVSRCLPRETALWGLLHDASEAYLGDVPRPVKTLPALAGYRALEALWQRSIYHRFGLVGELPADVTLADDAVLAWERRDLVDGAVRQAGLPPETLRGLRSVAAEQFFLARFQELTHEQ